MAEPIQVRFLRLDGNPDIPLPSRATAQAAGYDVRSAEADVELQLGEIRAVSTGFIMELPSGIECQVRPRSGLAARYGITLPNSPGTIDPDYRGELKVLLQNGEGSRSPSGGVTALPSSFSPVSRLQRSWKWIPFPRPTGARAGLEVREWGKCLALAPETLAFQWFSEHHWAVCLPWVRALPLEPRWKLFPSHNVLICPTKPPPCPAGSLQAGWSR